MATISNLIKFKNELIQRHDKMFEGVEEFVDSKVVNLKITEIDNFTIDYNDDLHTIISSYTNIISENAKIAEQLKNLIDKVDADIKVLVKETFATAEYQSKFENLNNINILYNAELDKTLRVRMNQYCDWKYPGLQYNVAEKKYTDCMTASDPLYITGENIDDAKKVIEDYPALYQSRLRIYTNNDWDKLPLNQFGFILVWNYFEYRSMIEIEEFLKKSMSLLRPGGVLMFSFNNCDLHESATAAEMQLMNYNSAAGIKDICAELGYKIISFNDAKSHYFECPWFSWAEIKRPGELVTTKAHQAIGQIIPK
jgi:hypothetical protein